MPVAVEGCLDGGLAELRLNDLQILPLGDQECGVGAVKFLETFRQKDETTKVIVLPHRAAPGQGAGVNLSLRMPEPIEFACEGFHFTAFGWMGQIYVMGEEVSPSDLRGAVSGTR